MSLYIVITLRGPIPYLHMEVLGIDVPTEERDCSGSQQLPFTPKVSNFNMHDAEITTDI